ncbi:hypothetical protein VMCG_07782 [Cytospora schulzeri]|uniref:Uncharacterized protein n=1 Tax=Cytospora schulzeri TaxID=448051 RepID=A0A423VZW3_9PEZI|nr:hypothetical protein VMCG_07782 [Valsa malicola]
MSRYPKRIRRCRPTYTIQLDSEDEEYDDDWRPAMEVGTDQATKAKYEIESSISNAKLTTQDPNPSGIKRTRGRRKKKKEEEKPFRFMDLPGELRNKIYKHLLCQPGDSPVFIGEVWSTELCRKRVVFGETNDMRLRAYKAYLSDTFNNFAILRTCKEVSAEAKSIMYGQKFSFYQVEALQSFLLRLSPATMALLRHVDITGYINAVSWKFLPAIFSLLRPATNLDYLNVADIQDFKHNTAKRILEHPPNAATMTVEEWDALLAQQVAREVYSHMYPYLQAAIQEKGAANVMKTLHVFGDLFERGPRRSSLGLAYGGFLSLRSPNPVVLRATESPARGSVIRAAVGEELARLVANDVL